MKLKDILAWLGLTVAILGFLVVLGACGGIERGAPIEAGALRVLTGLVMIGVGAVGLTIGIK